MNRDFNIVEKPSIGLVLVTDGNTLRFTDIRRIDLEFLRRIRRERLVIGRRTEKELLGGFPFRTEDGQLSRSIGTRLVSLARLDGDRIVCLCTNTS